MGQKNQTNNETQNKQGTAAKATAVAPPATVSPLMGGLGIDSATENRLSDTRFAPVQRQALASQLGRTNGNAYLQRALQRASQPPTPTAPLVQREDEEETTSAEPAKLNPEELLVVEAADRARKTPDDANTLSSSSAEVVNRLVQLHLPEYVVVLSHVMYSPQTANLEVEVQPEDQTAVVLVGKAFLLNTTAVTLNQRFSELKSVLEAKAKPLLTPTADEAPKEAEAQASDKPKAEDSPAVTPEDKDVEGKRNFRKMILERLKYWAGAVEGGSDGRFAEFRSDAVLETARKKAARDHITYTTCIDFQGQVLEEVGKHHASFKPAKDKKQPGPIITGSLARHQARIFNAWHEGGTTLPVPKDERPQKGDMYLLYDKDSHDTFSHIGYLEDIIFVDGVEKWVTVDGGQGSATNYTNDPDPDKQVIKGEKGAEKISRNTRTYLPETNLLEGESIQGRKWGFVRGWVIVDQLPKNEAELKALEPEMNARRAAVAKLEEAEAKLAQAEMIRQIQERIARLNAEAAAKKKKK